MAAMITLEHVTRTFHVGDEVVRALNDLSFLVQTGEFIVIIGRAARAGTGGS